MQREGELEKEQRAVANASERVLTKEDLTVRYESTSHSPPGRSIVCIP